jgi:signal transduction histidine kinase
MKKGVPALLVTVGIALLLGWYVLYTRRVIRELRSEARSTGQMYAQVYRALGAPDEEVTSALLDLSRHIAASGVPLVVTDAQGKPTAWDNLPADVSKDSVKVREFARQLDLRNAPVVEHGGSVVHYGDPPIVDELRIIPVLQATSLGLLLIAGILVLRTRSRADREKVWAGMARESAHQLATPLSSLGGWVELLADRAGDEMSVSAVTHMRADLERLERVAHRFERIGRPPRKQEIDAAVLAERVAAYFRARVPTLANTIRIDFTRPDAPLMVGGDPVLIEWALESLVKNAVDALAGRGGVISIDASPNAEGGARLRVADDGPGIPREMRSRIFQAGFSTKASGWGIGLSLARRIVEDGHGGRLVLVPTDRGATFEIILP